MKLLLIVISVLSSFLLMSAAQTKPLPPAIGSGSSSPASFVLSVRFQDPLNRDFEMRTLVRLGMRFHATAKNGNVSNDISGIVRRSAGGKYGLSLTTREWKSDKENVHDTTKFQLHLDQPQTAGPIFTSIYSRTVILSRLRNGERRP
jgi:hypothetical protein